MAKENRKSPRFKCNGIASVQVAPGLAPWPARIFNLSADGCSIELERPDLLPQDSIVELTFTIDDLPFRVWGQVKAIQSDTMVGFQFRLLSDRTRRRLENSLDQLIEDFITGAAPRCAGEKRQFPRIHCTGMAGVQAAAGEAFSPATIANLSVGGCLMTFQERQHLSPGAFVEMKFQVNHLPFRMQGQVRALRSATKIGFSISEIGERARTQLEDLLEELLGKHVERVSARTDLT
jgi:hypothetical protein